MDLSQALGITAAAFVASFAMDGAPSPRHFTAQAEAAFDHALARQQAAADHWMREAALAAREGRRACVDAPKHGRL